MIFGTDGHVCRGLVVEQIVGFAVEDTAELLHVAEVDALLGACEEFAGGVVDEAVVGEEGQGACDAFETECSGYVDSDHGSRI